MDIKFTLPIDPRSNEIYQEKLQRIISTWRVKNSHAGAHPQSVPGGARASRKFDFFSKILAKFFGKIQLKKRRMR